MTFERICLLLILTDDLLSYSRMIWIYRKNKLRVWEKMRVKYLGGLIYSAAWIVTFTLGAYYHPRRWVWVVVIMSAAIFRSFGKWNFDTYMSPMRVRQNAVRLWRSLVNKFVDR